MLFSPLTQRSLTFRNRIGVSPMCMYSCQDGLANHFHLVHLGARALGGAAVVIAEATSVSPEGRISPGDLGIWSDNHIEPLAPVTAFIRHHGAIPGIQLAHAGWKAGSRRPWDPAPTSPTPPPWIPLGVSPFPFTPKHPTPTEIKNPELIVEQFKSAARRSLAAGFQLIELHAAHGYLLHSFNSPISNRRTDNYGGSFDNRTRLTREVVSAVRSVWPDHLPLWIRFSCTDYVEGGWTLEDSVHLAQVLKPLGVDCIDCSSGGISATAHIPTPPGYQVPFAARIRTEANIHTAAVGLITTPTLANTIITSGNADLTLLGRESLRDPHFPLRAARELAAPLPVPDQYSRAY